MVDSSQTSTNSTSKAEIPSLTSQAEEPAASGNTMEKDDKNQSGTPTLNYNHERNLSDEQELGAIRMEAVYLVFGKGWKLWTLWGSIGVIAYVYALSQSTTFTYLAFATSAFGTHTITATIDVITAIMRGVIKPFIAKLSDLTSRPLAIAISVALYAIGYSVTAGAKNVDTVAAGEVIYTVGNTGIDFVLGIIQADITPLQWRGFVSGMTSLPFVPNAFIAGYITSGISAFSENGWRWGYGMFAIMVPVCIAPALLILFWADRRAKRLGALSLASSSYARRQQMGTEQSRSIKSMIWYWLNIIDAVGLVLIGFTFALLLSPSTLKATARGGYKNPSLIAMYCVGGILFLVFLLWEFRFAQHPIMPRRILNKTVLCSIGIDFMYYLSGYITSTYLLSWVFVTKGYSAKDYTYFSNILTVGLCFFGVIVGIIQRITHRYKYLQVFGICVRCIGVGLTYNATVGNHSDVNIVMAQVLISLGGACSVIGSQVATQASVPHRDMAMALALLSLWTSIGGSIGSAIAAEIWNTRLPRYLKEHLGDSHTDAELKKIFGSIVVAAAAEPRDQIIIAYDRVMHDLALPSLCLCFVALIFGLLTTNYYLGKTHNAVENREVTFRDKDETTDEAVRHKVEEVEAQARREVGAKRIQQEV